MPERREESRPRRRKGRRLALVLFAAVFALAFTPVAIAARRQSSHNAFLDSARMLQPGTSRETAELRLGAPAATIVVAREKQTWGFWYSPFTPDEDAHTVVVKFDRDDTVAAVEVQRNRSIMFFVRQVTDESIDRFMP